MSLLDTKRPSIVRSSPHYLAHLNYLHLQIQMFQLKPRNMPESILLSSGSEWSDRTEAAWINVFYRHFINDVLMIAWVL